MTHLSNRIFDFTIDPNGNSFDVSISGQNIHVVSSWPALRYRHARGMYMLDSTVWHVREIREMAFDTVGQGKIKGVEIVTAPDDHKIVLHLHFGLSDTTPLFFWRIKVENQGKESIWLQDLELLRIGGNKKVESTLELGKKDKRKLSFYSNGWQSWSCTSAYNANKAMRQTILGPAQIPMIYNCGTPRPSARGHFSSDFYGVIADRTSRSGVVIGFLSQKQHFGYLEASLKGDPMLRLSANGDDTRLESGKSVITDWAALGPVSVDAVDPLDAFFSAIARENEVKVPDSAPVGWCSWYQFYTKVTAQNIQENLEVIRSGQERIPVQLVQIDDGFESQIGDWFTFLPTFPDGVAPLAQEIANSGLQPGLWLAPFIVHPKSELIHKHPDWILRNKIGSPVNAGYVWGAFTTGLDLTHPDALEYACDVVDTAAHDWGFPYLKLDFLYAAALKGVRTDDSMTRAQILRKGMESIREAVGPETTLLGCGAPLGSMMGVVDAMRIGCDIGESWIPKFGGMTFPFKNEPSFPSGRDAILNIITRANQHNYFWINDPDCLLVRPNTELTLHEVQLLASVIALTGGSLLLSDDLPKVPGDRMRIAEALLPVIGKRAQVLDWIDEENPRKLRLDMEGVCGKWHLLGLVNWQDDTAEMTVKPSDFGLADRTYWLRSFWSRKSGQMANNRPATFKNVPAHGIVLLAVREVENGKAQYLGSDLHISQGVEIRSWMETDDELLVELALPRACEGEVELYLPKAPEQAWVDGSPVTWIEDERGRFEFPIRFKDHANLKIVFTRSEEKE